MSIPTYDQFTGPLLQYLALQTEPIRAKQVYAGVADIVDLTPEEKAQMLPSKGQAVYVNRIGWAHDALKRSLLSSSPKRGYWRLTQKGYDLSAKNPNGLSPEECNKIGNASRNTPLRLITGGEQQQLVTDTAPESQSPEEKIESGLRALRDSVAQDILETIGD